MHADPSFDDEQLGQGRQKARWKRLLRRWPGWQIRLVSLPDAREIFCWSQKLIFIDVNTPDLDWQVEHSVAHLALHTDGVRHGQWFTDRQEAEADMSVRLDRFEWGAA